MSTLSTFHLFPQLPGEIRLKVWALALAEPREITVGFEKGILDSEKRRSSEKRFAKWFTSPTPPPALLHLNQEARVEALAIYAPMFKTKDSERYIYINFGQDTLRCSDSLLQYIGKEERNAVERLVLDVKDTQYFGHFNMDHIIQMKKLVDLVLETGNTYVPSWDSPTRYLTTIANDFEDAQYKDPGWETPTVRILKRDTKELLKTIPGGALLSGWKIG